MSERGNECVVCGGSLEQHMTTDWKCCMFVQWHADRPTAPETSQKAPRSTATRAARRPAKRAKSAQ